MTSTKVYGSTAAALDVVHDGASIAVGGFGVSGVPLALIETLLDLGVAGLHIVSNNCGLDDWGLGKLLRAGLIARATASYVGENRELARLLLAGELELELTPQGTLAERLRAGGAGIPAFYTPAGVGTWVGDGGLPWRYGPDGSVVLASPEKEQRSFGGREFVLEQAIVTDVSLVHAWKGDAHGNLVYRKAARNFNPVCAMAGRVTIAEVEHLVEPGELDPDAIHTPGVFVQRIVHVRSGKKAIDKRTVRS